MSAFDQVMAAQCEARRRARARGCALRLAMALAVLGAATGARAQEHAYVPIESQLFLQGRPTEGLLVLHSGYRNHPYLDADAVAWVGAGDQADSDVLTVNIGVRAPDGYGSGRIGRFVLATGAVRAVHLDGIHLRGRAPSDSSLELFAGLPVVPEFGERQFDWLMGSRVAQRLWHGRLGVGLSYLHRRDAGMLADEEVGADLDLRPFDWLSVSSVAAFDVTQEGLASVRVRATATRGDVVATAFGEKRVAARLLPATSLFSVISDSAASEVGGDVLYHAFPRLDVGVMGALLARDRGDPDLAPGFGYRAQLRTSLRLDDEGRGRLSVKANRRDVSGAAFSGVAVFLQQPITETLRAHGTLELVAADEPGDRGDVWPWTRLGATYTFAPSWQLSGALQAKASPEARAELDGLLRLSYLAEVGP